MESGESARCDCADATSIPGESSGELPAVESELMLVLRGRRACRPASDDDGHAKCRGGSGAAASLTANAADGESGPSKSTSSARGEWHLALAVRIHGPLPSCSPVPSGMERGDTRAENGESTKVLPGESDRAVSGRHGPSSSSSHSVELLGVDIVLWPMLSAAIASARFAIDACVGPMALDLNSDTVLRGVGGMSLAKRTRDSRRSRLSALPVQDNEARSLGADSMGVISPRSNLATSPWAFARSSSPRDATTLPCPVRSELTRALASTATSSIRR